MFGYVLVHKPEMRVKEYETYKSVYCALCREMGRRYGILTRFTLSYDFTFFAVLCAGLTENEISAERKMCVCNPLKKCNYCVCENVFGLPAAASVITAYYKADDDRRDEKGIKKIRGAVMKLLLYASHKKAASDYTQIEKICKNYICEQKKVEKNMECDTDAAAHPTAEMLSRLFSLITDNSDTSGKLGRLGYCLGRWLYFIDAADDMEKDKKSGSYNVFIKNECDGEIIDRAINLSETAVREAYSVITDDRLRPITENILYMGLYESRKKVRSCAKNE